MSRPFIKLLSFLLFATLLVLFICFTWKPISSKIVDWYVKDYLKKNFGADLISSKVNHENLFWIFEKPLIYIPSTTRKLPTKICCESAEIQMLMSWKKPWVNLIVDLHDPVITIGESSSNIPTSNKSSPRVKNHLPLYFGINVDNGTLIVDGQEPVFFCLNTDYKNESKISFAIRKRLIDSQSILEGTLSINKNFIHLNSFFNNFELKKASDILSNILPLWNDWQVSNGILNGNFNTNIKKNNFTSMYGDLTLTDFEIVNSQNNFTFSSPQISFNSQNERSKNLSFSEQTNFALKKNDGSILELTDFSGEIFNNESAQLEFDFCGQASYNDHRGNFSLKGLFANWKDNNPNVESKLIFDLPLLDSKGSIVVCGSLPNPKCTIDLLGRISSYSFLLPLKYQNIFEDTFQNQYMKISSEITSESNTYHCKGISEFTDSEDKVEFQCDISRPQNLFDVGFKLISSSFNSSNISLEKYFSPFMFNQKINVNGVGDFQGAYSNDNLRLEYILKNISLENQVGKLTAPIVTNISKDKPEFNFNKHNFDLAKGNHDASLILTNATYLEKNSGLYFTDIKTEVSIQNQIALFNNLEAFCNGIYFGGGVAIESSKSEPNSLDLKITAGIMNGKVSQVQDFFSHFNSSLFLLKFPLEGAFGLRQKGGEIHFILGHDIKLVQATMQGCVNDATVFCPTCNVSIQDMSMNFDYDYQKHHLFFSDLEGSLLVGNSDRIEEYIIAGDPIHFTNYLQNEADFDIWVGDKNRDILRLAGNIKPIKNSLDSNEFVEVTFNNVLSHLGDAHPSLLNFKVKNWTEIEQIAFTSSFGFNSLINDFKKITRIDYFSIPKAFLKALNGLQKGKGDFKIEFHLDKKLGISEFALDGKGIEIGSYDFKKFSLNGHKQDDIWSIEQLLLDDISFAADILAMEDGLRVNFLGIRIEDAFMMGLDGGYNESLGKFNANINLLEINLGKLQKFSFLNDFLKKHSIQGNLYGLGSIILEIDPKNLSMSGNTNLNLTTKALQFDTYLFDDLKQISAQFSTGKKLLLKNVKVGFTDLNSQISEKNQIESDLISFDFKNPHLIIEGTKFHIPKNNFVTLLSDFQAIIPKVMSKNTLDLVVQVQAEDNLEGSFNLEISPPHAAFKLNLNPNAFRLHNREYFLKNFVLEYDPFEFKITTQDRYQNQNFWWTLRSASPNLERGELTFSHEYPHNENEHPLEIKWTADAQKEIVITHANGTFSGLSMHLNQDINTNPNKFEPLKGIVHVDFTKALDLIPLNYRDSLAMLKLGSGYSFNGDWIIDCDFETDNSNLWFKGQLKGDNCHFKGYHFHDLSAEVDFSPNLARLTQILLNDPSIEMKIDSLLARPIINDWEILAPTISIKQFRPSLLRLVGMNELPFEKPLFFRRIEFENVKGLIGDRNSITGSGYLVFANPVKKNLQNAMFAIPSEITNRLNLDLSVLNPVAGTVYFDISTGRFLFNKFKDVYSEGKLSKFYLPSSLQNSYIDFDGNLSLQVRMKQYNLVFKLAELFTLSINGTLKKPTYSLLKQSNKDLNQKVFDHKHY